MTHASAPVRIAAFVLLAALAACGPVKRINPPAASVQRLAIAPGGQLTLDLRVQNHSDLTTRVGRFDGEISLDGRAPQALAVPIDLDVPAHAAEVVTVSLKPGDALAADRSLRYRLLGRIVTEEPSGSYEGEHESMLSPVPGRPGEFR